MDGRLTLTTSNSEIYFFTVCDYEYTKNDTAQIKFVYESDFRKYNIIIGVNRDKISLSITTFDEGQSDNTFNVMTLSRGSAIRHTTVELEYFKFNFTSEEVSIDYGADFATLVLPCSYVTFGQNPKTTVMKILCKIPSQN